MYISIYIYIHIYTYMYMRQDEYMKVWRYVCICTISHRSASSEQSLHVCSPFWLPSHACNRPLRYRRAPCPAAAKLPRPETRREFGSLKVGSTCQAVTRVVFCGAIRWIAILVCLRNRCLWIPSHQATTSQLQLASSPRNVVPVGRLRHSVFRVEGAILRGLEMFVPEVQESTRFMQTDANVKVHVCRDRYILRWILIYYTYVCKEVACFTLERMGSWPWISSWLAELVLQLCHFQVVLRRLCCRGTEYGQLQILSRPAPGRDPAEVLP